MERIYMKKAMVPRHYRRNKLFRNLPSLLITLSLISPGMFRADVDAYKPHSTPTSEKWVEFEELQNGLLEFLKTNAFAKWCNKRNKRRWKGCTSLQWDVSFAPDCARCDAAQVYVRFADHVGMDTPEGGVQIVTHGPRFKLFSLFAQVGWMPMTAGVGRDIRLSLDALVDIIATLDGTIRVLPALASIPLVYVACRFDGFLASFAGAVACVFVMLAGGPWCGAAMALFILFWRGFVPARQAAREVVQQVNGLCSWSNPITLALVSCAVAYCVKVLVTSLFSRKVTQGRGQGPRAPGRFQEGNTEGTGLLTKFVLLIAPFSVLVAAIFIGWKRADALGRWLEEMANCIHTAPTLGYLVREVFRLRHGTAQERLIHEAQVHFIANALDANVEVAGPAANARKYLEENAEDPEERSFAEIRAAWAERHAKEKAKLAPKPAPRVAKPVQPRPAPEILAEDPACVAFDRRLENDEEVPPIVTLQERVRAYNERVEQGVESSCRGLGAGPSVRTKYEREVCATCNYPVQHLGKRSFCKCQRSTRQDRHEAFLESLKTPFVSGGFVQPQIPREGLDEVDESGDLSEPSRFTTQGKFEFPSWEKKGWFRVKVWTRDHKECLVAGLALIALVVLWYWKRAQPPVEESKKRMKIPSGDISRIAQEFELNAADMPHLHKKSFYDHENREYWDAYVDDRNGDMYVSDSVERVRNREGEEEYVNRYFKVKKSRGEERVDADLAKHGAYRPKRRTEAGRTDGPPVALLQQIGEKLLRVDCTENGHTESMWAVCQDERVVLPNHVHGIVKVSGQGRVTTFRAEDVAALGAANEKRFDMAVAPDIVTGKFRSLSRPRAAPIAGERVWMVTRDGNDVHVESGEAIGESEIAGVWETSVPTRAGDCGCVYVNSRAQIVGYHVGADLDRHVNLFVPFSHHFF